MTTTHRDICLHYERLAEYYRKQASMALRAAEGSDKIQMRAEGHDMPGKWWPTTAGDRPIYSPVSAMYQYREKP